MPAAQAYLSFVALQSADLIGVAAASVPTITAALQRHNEQKLREAFERSKDVFLIFSVNMSGHFQGYARMISVGNQNQVCFSCKPKLPSKLPYASKQFGPSCVVLAHMQLSVSIHTCILPDACSPQVPQYRR